jgi:hypothetical protein
MNELDSLESELRSLNPRGVSARLERQLSDRLACVERERRPWPWSASLAAALAAASIAAVLFWSDGKRTASPAKSGKPEPALVSENIDAAPTVQVYRSVLASSPGAFNAMLDRQAARTLAAGSQRVGLRAFTRSDERYSSLGEEL